MNDSDMIALYFNRDETAIVASQKQYGQYCASIAQSILRNPSDVEECVNDTWLAAWQSIPPQRPSCLRTYLGRLTRNISINRHRANSRQKRNPEYLLSLEELAACIPAPDDGDTSYLTDLLNEFLGSLDALDRKLFVGRYWYNRSVKVLAEGYGMTPNATSVRLSRIRDKLRAYLTERGYPA